MFEKTRPFKVKLRGRSGIEYIENKRRAIFVSEFMSSEDPGIVIYSDDLITWEPPFDTEDLSSDDLERIKSNVVEYLKAKKIIAEWD
jgi:hypothetical protein